MPLRRAAERRWGAHLSDARRRAAFVRMRPPCGSEQLDQPCAAAGTGQRTAETPPCKLFLAPRRLTVAEDVVRLPHQRKLARRILSGIDVRVVPQRQAAVPAGPRVRGAELSRAASEGRRARRSVGAVRRRRPAAGYSEIMAAAPILTPFLSPRRQSSCRVRGGRKSALNASRRQPRPLYAPNRAPRDS